jgi:hypothetical protein
MEKVTAGKSGKSLIIKPGDPMPSPDKEYYPSEFERGKRAGLEAAARKMCPTCSDQRFTAAEKIGNAWGHRCGDNYVHCYAHAIWEIRAIAQPEPHLYGMPLPMPVKGGEESGE